MKRTSEMQRLLITLKLNHNIDFYYIIKVLKKELTLRFYKVNVTQELEKITQLPNLSFAKSFSMICFSLSLSIDTNEAISDYVQHVFVMVPGILTLVGFLLVLIFQSSVLACKTNGGCFSDCHTKNRILMLYFF